MKDHEQKRTKVDEFHALIGNFNGQHHSIVAAQIGIQPDTLKNYITMYGPEIISTDHGMIKIKNPQAWKTMVENYEHAKLNGQISVGRIKSRKRIESENG